MRWVGIWIATAALAGGMRPHDARAAAAAADSTPRIPERDRIRLAEAFRVAAAVQDEVWPQWSTAPFAVLLVTPEVEFLVRHPSPDRSFAPAAYDSLLGSRVYWRRRVFPAAFQATFPAVGGVSTIVIGQAENARPQQNSTRWVLTVLHEHFHQWQESRPGYIEAVNGLELARGDSTGMWMLDFPFPYADSTISRSFDEWCRLSAAALRARGGADFAPAFRRWDEARVRLQRRLAPDDGRYVAFQLWKEGVARYTEYRLARVAAANKYRPSPQYRSLADYTSFEVEADRVLDQIVNEQASLRLSEWRRVAVYSTGAAEALLLDVVRPNWREDYTRERFSLDGLFPASR